MGRIPLVTGSASGSVAYRATACGRIPRVRGVASATGGNRALGLIPPLIGHARGTTNFDPSANMAFAGIPLLAGRASGIVFYPGSQLDAGIPRVRGAAYAHGTSHARGFVPLVRGVAWQKPTFDTFFLMVQSQGVMHLTRRAPR